MENILPNIYDRDENGYIVSSTWFCLADFDENYVYVNRYHYNEANDTHENNQGRFAYSYNDEDRAAILTSDFEVMVVKWLTIEENKAIDVVRNEFENIKSAFDALNDKHDALQKDFDAIKAENDTLAAFKAETLSVQRKENEEIVFAKFEKELGKEEEFISLKSNCADFSIDDK